MLGTWLFNDYIHIDENLSPTFEIKFECNNINYVGMEKPGNLTENGSYEFMYISNFATSDGPVVYGDDWLNQAYRTITITDTSSLTNREEFTTWLKANAVKQTGGGASN